MNNKYYALEINGKEADIYIFGDITSWEWLDNDVSSYTLSKELQELGDDIDVINVHINSYGGEVAEGLAIYNMLRNHKAKVRTYCDGFACSIASVIFMAGDERIMNSASLLFIHNAWTCACGNANDFRKQADDLDKITQASIEAYKSRTNISEEEIKELLDNETWILPSEALEMGFATAIVGEATSDKAAASARKALFNLVKNVSQKEPEPKPAQEPAPEPEPDLGPGQEPEPVPEPQENKPTRFFNALIK
ncbi:MAG TPA: ATP-dependent Clp protease proteolytic subunit [Acetivibrio sp.]|nr:ATP-dependent Clp protease proteolytic subunit [Acetivibrio sp.]